MVSVLGLYLVCCFFVMVGHRLDALADHIEHKYLVVQVLERIGLFRSVVVAFELYFVVRFGNFGYFGVAGLFDQVECFDIVVMNAIDLVRLHMLDIFIDLCS